MKMKYVDAISKYGSDKPDLRFGMEIQDITTILKDTTLPFFQKVLNENGIINAKVIEVNDGK